MRTEHAFDHFDALAAHLSEHIARLLREAVAQKGQATLAVSGGTSPIPIFERLSRLDLPWDKVTVTLVDERCVPVGHPDSNGRLIQTHLLQHGACQAQWVPWIADWPADEVKSEAACMGECTARLQQLIWPLDVLLLGMGNDGHTASLFPCSDDLHNALQSDKPCTLVHPRSAKHTRLTLTLGHILSARHVLLQCAGPDKRTIYQQACLAADDRWPVSHVLNAQDTLVDVWLA